MGAQINKGIILIEGFEDRSAAKTAISLLRYRGKDVVAVLDGNNRGKTTQELLGAGRELPVIGNLSDCPSAKTLVLGTAPGGGRLPDRWRSIIAEAIKRGLNIVSGLHDFLSDDAEFRALAIEHQVEIHDIRKIDFSREANRTGIREDCLRIHAVGQDCNVGKMVVCLETTSLLQRLGYDAQFVATGQTGIMIAGDGLPIDAIRANCVSGAAEELVLRNQQHDILLIEGQGAITSPMYSGVTVGLLHGCMPHGLIMCYQVGREYFRHTTIRLLSLKKTMEATAALANGLFPTKFIGIGMNGRDCSDAEAGIEKERVEAELGLPVVDVYREGSQKLADAVLKLQKELFPNPSIL